MNPSFDTTAWLAHTFLVMIALLAAVPLLRATFGLLIVLATRAVGASNSRLHAFGSSLLPVFLRGALGVTTGVSLLTSPAFAAEPKPSIVIDRIVEIDTPAPISQHSSPELEFSSDSALTYQVRAGDSLWAIARARLRESGTHPTNLEIDGAWRELWQLNRSVIGDDPSLIHPGQVLALPSEPSAQ